MNNIINTTINCVIPLGGREVAKEKLAKFERGVLEFVAKANRENKQVDKLSVVRAAKRHDSRDVLAACTALICAELMSQSVSVEDFLLLKVTERGRKVLRPHAHAE